MENSGNYSMMKREAVDALLTMKEKVRYLPGLGHLSDSDRDILNLSEKTGLKVILK